MNCPRCNGQIQAEDANLSTLVARCRMCQEVFRFADQLGPLTTIPSDGHVRKPENVVVEDRIYGPVRRIWWKWCDSRAAFLFITVLIACGWICPILIVQPAIEFESRVAEMEKQFANVHRPAAVEYNDWHRLRGFLLFAAIALPIAIGAAFTYVGVACFTNRTAIELDENTLVVRRGPVPLLCNYTYPIKEIQSVSLDVESFWVKGVLRQRFDVRVVTRDGRRQPLLELVQTPEFGRYIAGRLQEWLSEERVAVSTITNSVPAGATVTPSEAVWRPL
jgi:hypothetical protein